MGVNLTKEQKQEILQQSDRLTARQLAEQYGCSRSLILKIWMDNNYHKPLGFHYYVDDNYFSSIDSANKAYILGFIASDGNVYKRAGHKGQLRLCLKDGDSERKLLQQILEDMRATNHIKSSTNNGRSYIAIDIVSQQIFEDLCSIGVAPNKTWGLNINKIINNIPLEFYCDFIRGYFDGDGCITSTDNKKPSGIRISIACPSYSAPDFIKILNDVGIVISFIKDKRQEKYKNDFGVLSLSGYNKYIFLKYLYYPNCMCLERKLQRAIVYCDLIECNSTNRAENIKAMEKYEQFLMNYNNLRQK